MTTQPKSLNERLFSIMQAIDAIPKDGYNDFHKYAYATERAIKDAVRTELLKERVLFRLEVDNVSQSGEMTTINVKAIFTAVETSESICVPFSGQGADKGDKGIYKAITGAIKYALTSTFLIPTGDDPEAESHAPARKTTTTPKPVTVDTHTGEVQDGKKVCQVCGQGMTYREGMSKAGKPWKAWMCASHETSHTEWIK